MPSSGGLRRFSRRHNTAHSSHHSIATDRLLLLRFHKAARLVALPSGLLLRTVQVEWLIAVLFAVVKLGLTDEPGYPYFACSSSAGPR
jgi:hypothetical protein